MNFQLHNMVAFTTFCQFYFGVLVFLAPFCATRTFLARIPLIYSIFLSFLTTTVIWSVPTCLTLDLALLGMFLILGILQGHFIYIFLLVGLGVNNYMNLWVVPRWLLFLEVVVTIMASLLRVYIRVAIYKVTNVRVDETFCPEDIKLLPSSSTWEPRKMITY